MLVERRRSAIPAEFVIRVGAAWAIVSALLLVVHWSAIASGRFPESDDVLRLVQVRDLLAGQSWFDVTQYRIDAANDGVSMQWSRLVDIPLAAVIFVLTPIFGAPAAEAAAVVIVPMITLGCAMLLAARIAWKLLGDEEATLTSLIFALSVPVIFQFGPMRIADDGWQVVCALTALNAMMARSPGMGGIGIGLALAVWVSISIEGLPLTMAIFALLAWRWIRNRNARPWLVRAAQTFAITGAAVFVLTRGISGSGNYCGAIGPVHLASFAVTALGLTGLARLEPLPRGIVFGGIAIVLGAAAAILVAAAPQCAVGGSTGLDPIVAQYLQLAARDGLAIWHQKLITILQYAITPVIGFVAAFNLASRSRDWLRQFWFDYALILVAAFAVSLFVARSGAIACALAAPPLAWQVRSWLRSIRSMRRPAPRVVATAALALALLPALPVILLANAIPAQAALSGGTALALKDETAQSVPTCNIDSAVSQLNALAVGEVYAPLGLAPGLLLHTRHRVIATDHHSGVGPMKQVIDIAVGTSEQAREILQDRGTAYVATCPNLPEWKLYAREVPGGFAAQVASDRTPAWLEPISINARTDLKLWRVIPANQAGTKSIATPLIQ